MPTTEIPASRNPLSPKTQPQPGQKTVEVRLLGQRMVLKTSEGDPELLNQVIDLVSRKLKEAEDRSRGAAPHQIALLAMLDLAEEYFKAKKRTQEFKKEVDQKSSLLLSLIEAELK